MESFKSNLTRTIAEIEKKHSQSIVRTDDNFYNAYFLIYRRSKKKIYRIFFISILRRLSLCGKTEQIMDRIFLQQSYAALYIELDSPLRHINLTKTSYNNLFYIRRAFFIILLRFDLIDYMRKLLIIH